MGSDYCGHIAGEIADSGGNPMFDRYTDRARRALVIAQDEALNLGHAHVGSGHLLLGLIGEDGGVAAVALKSLGASLEDARRTVARTEDRPGGVSRTGLPLTPRLAKILELAVPHEAFMLGNPYIATEHLLLGLASGSAPGASPLVAIGVNPDEARAKVLTLLRGYEEAGKQPVTPALADDPLSAALNDLSSRHHVIFLTGGEGVCESDRHKWPCHAYRALTALGVLLYSHAPDVTRDERDRIAAILAGEETSRA